ncbi:hypothetical protein HPB47_028265 [Ixodes persulcatus]|uniref:Uncharacterized protein n=1 Tax=Ixodes persulcatus TaxID=34615 RepID=A0AC60PTS4_IXOPE|nr:hypothetical protein HPB47_028265 [Ixodes persulcatus]
MPRAVMGRELSKPRYAKPPREESLGAPAITCVYVTATRPTARLRCSSVPARQMEPACFGVFPERSKVKNGWKQLVSAYEALRNAWINAIPRENLIVSQRTKACERHFSDDDILREVSHVDEVTGRTVTAPLSRVRLRPGAVPSKFPGCPDYLSKHHARREDPDSKRLRQEASAMERALAESIDSFRNEEEADRILSIKDLSDHLKNVKSAFWHAIEGNGHLTLVHIVETEAPWIKYSMSKRVDFLTMSNQRQLVTELTLDLFIDEDCSDFDVLPLRCHCARLYQNENNPFFKKKGGEGGPETKCNGLQGIRYVKM